MRNYCIVYGQLRINRIVSYVKYTLKIVQVKELKGLRVRILMT